MAQIDKPEVSREPKILIVGRNLDVMEILKDELAKFNRKVVYANSNELIKKHLNGRDIDLIVVGAGLPDETRNAMGQFIKELQPDIALFLIERTPDSSPVKMIDFTNEKAIMWKIKKALDPIASKSHSNQ